MSFPSTVEHTRMAGNIALVNHGRVAVIRAVDELDVRVEIRDCAVRSTAKIQARSLRSTRQGQKKQAANRYEPDHGQGWGTVCGSSWYSLVFCMMRVGLVMHPFEGAADGDSVMTVRHIRSKNRSYLPKARLIPVDRIRSLDLVLVMGGLVT